MRVVPFLLVALVSLAGVARAGVVWGRLSLPPHAREASLLEAVVYINPLPAELGRKWRPTRRTFTVVQRERRFVPRVIVVPMGSAVRFRNRDDVYHNVFSVSPAKRFDLGKYPPKAVNQVTFSRVGIVNLFCDIHPGMAAWVLVLPHRLYVRPKLDGAFALPKLPPGRYTLIAWHPSFGRVTRRIVMPSRGDVRVELRF